MRQLPRMLTTGTHAPTVAVPDDTGTPRAMADFHGEWLVLWFYPKDFTSGCTGEAGQFRDAYDEFRAAGAQIVGVSRDSVASHADFRTSLNLPFHLLADTDETLCSAYGVLVERTGDDGKPYMGVQRSTFLIDPTGVIRHSWPKVTVPGHAAEVLATLKLLTEQR
jgi:thioredoxin-dependent peroxiredoxin